MEFQQRKIEYWLIDWLMDGLIEKHQVCMIHQCAASAGKNKGRSLTRTYKYITYNL